jgi:hypothetical protein
LIRNSRGRGREAEADRAAAVGNAIDALFENSGPQTHTETETAFRAG